MLLISHHLLTVTYNHFPPFSLYEWDQLMNYLIIRNSSNMVCTRSCPLIGFLKSSITPHTVGMLIIWITLFFQHPGNNPEHLARFLHCSSIPFYSFYRDAPPKHGKMWEFFPSWVFFWSLLFTTGTGFHNHPHDNFVSCPHPLCLGQRLPSYPLARRSTPLSILATAKLRVLPHIFKAWAQTALYVLILFKFSSLSHQSLSIIKSRSMPV